MRKILAAIPLAALAMLAAFFAFIPTALAASAVTPEDGSLLDDLRPIYDQIVAGHYLAATAFALVLVVAAAKKYAPAGKAQNFIHSDIGGALTTLALAFFGALATATAAGATWHWGMLGTAGMVAFTAAGGYALIKKLVVPYLKTYAAAHTWAQAPLALILWIFDKPDAVAGAEAAGAAAVAAKPGEGVAAVTGAPSEVK